jgi:hypothetical protein
MVPVPDCSVKHFAMSDSKIRGVVHLIEATKSFGQKGFRKRLVVLEQNLGKFMNYVPLEFIGDACDRIDDLHVGDEIEANYRLSGRKWQRDPQSEVKYFLSAEGLGYQILSGGGKTPAGSDDPNDAFAEASYDDGDAPF